MIKFKLLLNKFQVLVLLLPVLIFISFVTSVSTVQEDYKVAFDETSPFKKEGLIFETAWYGSSNFANSLRNNGFNVSKISDKPITHEKLKGYDILIILSSNEDYSWSEIDAIEKFVENGGGLLLAVDHWRGKEEFATAGIAKRFGVSFARDVNICDPLNYYTKDAKDIVKISDIKSHAITKNVSSFYYDRGTCIINSGSSNVLANTSSEAWCDDVWDGDWGNVEKDPDEITGPFPILSEMTYGKGKIVFIGSRSLFINDWLNSLDNGQLGLNIVNWLANLPTTSIFIPPSTSIVTPTTSLEYRIAGIIIVTLLLFIGVIFKIRKDEKREKQTTIKPVENWKVNALLFGHMIAGAWGFFLVLWGLVSFDPADPLYGPYEGYMVLLTSIPFCLITLMILYNFLLHKKLPEKYLYSNIALCVFCTLFCASFGDLMLSTNFPTIVEVVIGYFIIISVPLSIPNFMSLLIIKAYGRELTIKGKEVEVKGLPKPPTKTLPAELKRYYLDAEYIGEGGFAWVFRATGKEGEKVAIKIPKSSDEKTGKLFIREVSNWSTLEHENIVTLYDFNIFPIPYLEMELCDGSFERGKRSVEEAVSTIFDIAKGLRYAHERRIIHGAIKLSNILIKEGRAKISDWGLSKVKRKRSVSLSGITPQYAAPEQISREFGKADERTDIYQLGGVFYELVTEKPPFEGEITEIYEFILHNQPKLPSEINPDSKCVEHIIMKCLSKKKEERYQSVDELIKELEDYKSVSRISLIQEKSEGGRETLRFSGI